MADYPAPEAAADTGSGTETYNPCSVVNLVFHHLAGQGLHPVLGDAGDPGGPAADLLRALGGGAALLHAGPALDALNVSGDYAAGVAIVRNVLTEPARLIAANAGYDGHDVISRIAGLGSDEGFDALEGRFGNMIEMGIVDPLRVARSALQNGASVAGLLLTTNTLVAEEQTPWGGSPALMTEFGPLDEGLHQPSPDSTTPQSLGLGPSVG
jgi:chaperonin GroEL